MKPLSIAEMGSFHIGGAVIRVEGLSSRTVSFTPDSPPVDVDENGDFDAFQMYVQYVKLADTRARSPLLLWHGGSLTGSGWESTPDGRPGWQTFFLRAGWNVYVSDAVERGRASWARFPQIYASEPIFRSKREAWQLFRIEGSAFPIEAFDAFSKSLVPRWTTNDAHARAAYARLHERLGTSTVIGHSQGAAFALQAALECPAAVSAVVALEPSSLPDPAEAEIAELKNVPHLFVWGDGVQGHAFWQPFQDRSRRYHQMLLSHHVDSEFLDLPKSGVSGNSHMVMLDRNSDAVAELVLKWLGERGLAL